MDTTPERSSCAARAARARAAAFTVPDSKRPSPYLEPNPLRGVKDLLAFVLFVALLVIGALCLVGCASPAAPSAIVSNSSSETAHVTLYATLSTVDGPALAGVEARVNGRAVAVTDASGRASFDVPAGRELTISVAHPTYRPFIPSATATLQPGARETWRFAFEP